jgi:hypothetical protein
MGFELTDQEAEDLVNRILADAWDPDAGKTAEVSNKYLEQADQLDRRWRMIKWSKSK